MKQPLILLVPGLVLLSLARADTLPALIDPNNPAKASRDITPPTPPAPAPKVTIQKPESKLTPDTPIRVNHIQFIGGTVYPLKSLLEPFRPYAQKTVPLKTLVALVNDITARYKADGYPLSYAWLPDNNFQNGNIKIVLVEGYVAHTDINSNNPKIAARLQRLAEKIMADKPLTQDTFDRYSQLMTQTPGVPVDANAQLPKNIYGAAAMQITGMQPHIWDISSSIDTRKGQDLALVNGTLSNLTSYGDQLGVATLIPLDKDTRKTYFGMNWQQFLNDEGLTMQLKGSYYREDPRDFTPLLDLPNNISINAKQKSTQYNGGISFGYPLILTRKEQLNVTGGMDYTDRRDDYDLQAQLAGQTYGLDSQHQHVRYPALEVGINGTRIFDTTSISSRLVLRQGIDSLGADAAPAQGTDLNFTLGKGYLDAAWMMAEKWKLSTSWEGDWSNNDLPEPERVSFGAQHFGRGYQDGEASGDYGYGGQLELRYLHMRPQSTWLATIQPYVLTDTAQTWYNQPGLRHQRLGSVAAGLMFGDNRHYSLSVEAAKPVGDVPTDSNNRDWRYSLTFTWNFNNRR
ncbi:ShlB/FhaC/HecB family hemolysin secretion/activation protein [Enterobacteriaceae bacterium 89]|nr:ShlB/FhaC/HecB family hemolysin secretion/activation protein [Enterobacteriaceae bacterium 89]